MSGVFVLQRSTERDTIENQKKPYPSLVFVILGPVQDNERAVSAFGSLRAQMSVVPVRPHWRCDKPANE